MSKARTSSQTTKKDDTPFMERLPSNVPFVPIIRRPDYQLRFIKLSVPTSIPVELILAVVFIGLFFIYMGGFYDLAQDSLSAFGSDQAGNPMVIYPSQLDSQFLVEGMAAGLLMFIGAGGFFLIHHSTQYAYSPKNATILLVVGIGIVALAWVAIMYMLLTKMGIW